MFTWSRWLPHGGWMQTGGWRSKTHCVAFGTLCFTSLRVEAAPATGQHTVGNPPSSEGVLWALGQWACAHRLPDRIGELSDTTSLLSCLYVQLCSCRLGWASVGDCPETVCPCKQGRYSTIPKADIPVFLPIVMNAMSLHYPVVTLILSL